MENNKIIVPEEVAKFSLEKFNELYKLDIAKMIENVKMGEGGRTLTYLSWSRGYKIMKEQDPNSKANFLINPETGGYIFPETVENEVEEEITTTKTVTQKKEIWDSKTKELKEGCDVEVITTTETVKTKEFRIKKKTTYMVKTEVTMFGITLGMFLPVMNAKYKAMEMPTSRDISDALMRCFAKNLSLFGIGLPLYNKEDLERFYEGDMEERTAPAKKNVPTDRPVGDSEKEIKDFIMNVYRTNKQANVVKLFSSYCKANGMVKDLPLEKLKQLSELLTMAINSNEGGNK